MSGPALPRACPWSAPAPPPPHTMRHTGTVRSCAQNPGGPPPAVSHFEANVPITTRNVLGMATGPRACSSPSFKCVAERVQQRETVGDTMRSGMGMFKAPAATPSAPPSIAAPAEPQYVCSGGRVPRHSDASLPWAPRLGLGLGLGLSWTSTRRLAGTNICPGR